MKVTERMLVPFQGEGCGVAELSWGQRELWGGMVQQRTWFPIGLTRQLPPGTTLDQIVAELRYLMGRHQSLRTRLRFAADGWPLQVVAYSGEVPLEVIDVDGDTPPATVAARVESRYRETDYDFVSEWPVRMAVVRRRGIPTHQVTIMCHLVTDGLGAVAMAEDLADRDPVTGRARAPAAALPPLAQARWQRSPAGRKQNEAALRYWEGLLRTIPARRFKGPHEESQPRYWQAMFESRAMYLATSAIAVRTGVDTSSVLLAAFSVALARVTGINPVVTRVLVSNRFRPGLADVVAPISQPGLCVIDVAAATIDDVVARTKRRTLAAYKYAYYDTSQLDKLIERVGEERGEALDVACFFNDRRLPRQREVARTSPSRAQLDTAIADTTFRWGSKLDRPTERFFLHVEDVPDRVGISMWADTRYTAPADIERFLRQLEAGTVEAAFDPAAPTRVPADRGAR